MEKEELIQQLLRFKDKAYCTYTHDTASSIWRKINKYIPEPYRFNIQLEWGHVQSGHGLSQACSALNYEIEKCIEYLRFVRR